MAFTLPELGYDYDALEPFIGRETLEIHHGKHHQAYVNNANKAMEGLEGFEGLCPGQVLARLNEIPEERRTAVRNNVGGHANHCLLWKCMKTGTVLEGALLDAINRDFGSVSELHKQLSAAATGHFGSGWAWLMLSKEGKLFVASTPNQDSPLMGKEVAGFEGYPLLTIDVWEHAYYLNYQNRRPDYAETFWLHLINWDYVAKRFEQAGNPYFHC